MKRREEAAEGSIREIERDVEQSRGPVAPVDDDAAIEIRPATQIGYLALARSLFRYYRGVPRWSRR